MGKVNEAMYTFIVTKYIIYKIIFILALGNSLFFTIYIYIYP